jgi:hypothetical protein
MTEAPGRPSVRIRVIVALGCAIAAALVVLVVTRRAPANDAADFTAYWRAGRALLDGLSPYDVINDVGPYPYQSGFLYPIVAAIVAMPFALLSMHGGWIAWGATCTGVMAFCLTRENFARLPLLMSLPMLTALQQGQIAPVAVLSALAPALAFLGGVKPTLGFAVFAGFSTARQARTFVLAGVAVLVLATAIYPWWPAGYANELRLMPPGDHRIPVAVLPFGPLIVFAALRWRHPDARRVLALACVPQVMLFYDQLPLILLARTFRQSLVLALASYAPLVVAPFVQGPADNSESAFMASMAKVLVVAYYLPCVAWVLYSTRRAGARAGSVSSLTEEVA